MISAEERLDKKAKATYRFHDPSVRAVKFSDALLELQKVRDELRCKECDMPTWIKREPAFLDNNALSIALYFDDKCHTCGHQKSGWTMEPVYKFAQKVNSKTKIRIREKTTKEIDEYIRKYSKSLKGIISDKAYNQLNAFRFAYKEHFLEGLKKS